MHRNIDQRISIVWCNGHGCNCNRPTIETITAAGFEITELERDVLRKASPIVTPLVIGIAQTNGQPA